MVKNSPAKAGDRRDACSIPGSRRSPGGGLLQYSCLENLVEREVLWATVQMITESDMTEVT